MISVSQISADYLYAMSNDSMKMRATAMVTADDQKMINRFARLHQKSIEVKGKLQDANKEFQNVKDASDELLLLDDDDVKLSAYKIGSVFIHMDKDELNEKLEKTQAELEKKITEYSETQEELCNEMDSLKKILYGKFGDSINLETEAES